MKKLPIHSILLSTKLVNVPKKKIVFLRLLILYLLSILSIFFSRNVYAQYGFSANTSYSQQWSIEDDPLGLPYPKYDFYGNWLGNYQLMRHAEWHSSSGGQTVTTWGPLGWQTQWVSGYYYWFTWSNYERRIS